MRNSSIDPRRILEIPFFYNLLQDIVGANSFRKKFIKQNVPHTRGLRILEVGCGTGKNLEYLPKGIEYIGYDISKKYIEQARRKYKGRGVFINASVDDVFKLNLGKFDLILAIAVLHHLDDIQVKSLAEWSKQLLCKSGSFIATDPCWIKNQSWVEKFVTTMDRGKYIRYPAKYKNLLKLSFSNVNAITSKEFFLHLIPTSGCSIRAWQD